MSMKLLHGIGEGEHEPMRPSRGAVPGALGAAAAGRRTSASREFVDTRSPTRHHRIGKT